MDDGGEQVSWLSAYCRATFPSLAAQWFLARPTPFTVAGAARVYPGSRFNPTGVGTRRDAKNAARTVPWSSNEFVCPALEEFMGAAT
jgi:hypothetical protein